MSKKKLSVTVFLLSKNEIIAVFEKWLREFSEGRHRYVTKKSLKLSGVEPYANEYADYFLKLRKQTLKRTK